MPFTTSGTVEISNLTCFLECILQYVQLTVNKKYETNFQKYKTKLTWLLWHEIASQSTISTIVEISNQNVSSEYLLQDAKLTIQFMNITLTPGLHSSCADNLRIFWGRNFVIDHVRTLCGPVVQTDTDVYLDANCVGILFHKSREVSNDTTTTSSFRFDVSHVPGNGNEMRCPGSGPHPATSTYSIVTSPGYPLVAPRQPSACHWILETSADMVSSLLTSFEGTKIKNGWKRKKIKT